MALPYYREYGWVAHVLGVQPEYASGISDPQLGNCLPEHVEVTRTKALPIRWTKFISLSDLGLRSWAHLFDAGVSILSKKKYDLVFFSTNAFMVLTLGPIWRRKFGIPYVVDFQDLWLSQYHGQPSSPKPPGGYLKYGLSQILARLYEPQVMRYVSHVISVSKAYNEKIMDRYPWLKPDQFTVLPFGAAEADFEHLRCNNYTQTYFSPKDGNTHWVYVGRGGDDMALSLRAFFLALKKARQDEPGRYSKLRLHFIGTDYAPSDRARKTIEPRARECGVESLVEEIPQRIPYFQALKCLLDADALIVPGSDDPDYTASKIYPYILARRPLLAIFHEKSSVVDLIQKTNAGTIVTFRSGDAPDKISVAILSKWFTNASTLPPQTDWRAFEPYTAREMARRQSDIFDQIASTTNRAI